MQKGGGGNVRKGNLLREDVRGEMSEGEMSGSGDATLAAVTKSSAISGDGFVL